MLVMLYNWILKNEYAPRGWREEVVVDLLRKGDKADTGDYGGKPPLSIVSRTFCKTTNDRRSTMMEPEDQISERQAGFRPTRSSVDHVSTLGKITQGRTNAVLSTYCFFLDAQAAYDTLWRNGLWKNDGKEESEKKCGESFKN